MATDLVIVYSPVGGGHKSAAIAVDEAARARGLRTVLVNAFDYAPRVFTDVYVGTHLTGQSFAPELYGEIYFAANKRRRPLEPVRLGIDNLVFGRVADAVIAHAPRAVIATHHIPLVVLGRARRKRALDAPVVGVVTDYTAHAHWAEEGVDAWAASNGAARDLLLHGAEPSRVFATGIPVRSAFERVDPLSYDGGELRVLVTSGGFGHGPMTRVVRSFAGIRDVSLTVVCGASEKLAARVTREVQDSGLRATVIGVERDMAARMAEAHVVVGKAGGLTVSETLTAGRPMVIASAVPGNEKLNEAFVIAGGAGVPADASDVGRVVDALRSGDVLTTMSSRARGLVARGAADRVLDVAFAFGFAERRARPAA